MKEVAIMIAVAAQVGLIAAGLTIAQNVRAREILRRWATSNDLTLTTAEYRLFRTGPFFMNSYRGQFVYRVTVRDRADNERSGWIRVGSWFGGVLSDETKVIWDFSA